MDPYDYWRALRKFWVGILILGLIGGAVAYGYAHKQKNSYQTSSSVFVTAAQGSANEQITSGSTFVQNQVASYTQLALTPSVLNPVIADLDLDITPFRLAQEITATTPLNTVLVRITVTDGDPKRAASIANGVVASLRTVAANLAPKSAAGDSVISMSVVAPASVPTSPVGPNRKLIEAIGIVIGLALGILLAVIRTAAETRLLGPRDVERLTDTPVIASIERHPRSERNSLALRDRSRSAEAEDFRRLATTLRFAGVDGRVQSLTVVSASHGEGRTRAVLDIALASAERSLSVLVIDADLRNPGVADATRLGAGKGVTDVLDGGTTLAEAARPWIGGVDVLTAGGVPSNASVVVGSAALPRLLAEAVASYDLVVVDVPALDEYSDALTVSKATDGVLVLAQARTTKRAALTRTLDALEGVHAGVVGIVLTQVNSGRRRPGVVAPTSTPGTADSGRRSSAGGRADVPTVDRSAAAPEAVDQATATATTKDDAETAVDQASTANKHG